MGSLFSAAQWGPHTCPVQSESSAEPVQLLQCYRRGPGAATHSPPPPQALQDPQMGGPVTHPAHPPPGGAPGHSVATCLVSPLGTKTSAAAPQLLDTAVLGILTPVTATPMESDLGSHQEVMGLLEAPCPPGARGWEKERPTGGDLSTVIQLRPRKSSPLGLGPPTCKMGTWVS